MKNRSRVLVQLLLLLLLLIFSGCSEDAPQSSSAVEAVSIAEQTSKILEIIGERELFARTEKLIPALRAVPIDQTTDVFREVLDGIKIPNREFDRLLVVTAWAKHNGIGATKWVMVEERDEVVRGAMFSETVYAWASEDLESFFSDTQMVHYMEPGIDSAILRAMIRGWFDSGEPHLEQYIRDMTPQSVDRQRAIETLIRLMIERDGAAATVEWAKKLTGDFRFRSTVYSRAAGQVAAVDSKLALDWCAEVCDSPLGEGMPHMMAVRLSRKSGDEAMNFIISQPNALEVRTGARAAYRNFLIYEPDRASAWMEATTEEQRRGPVLGGPVGMYANKLSRQGEPVRAIEWLEYLPDENEREDRLIPIMRRWLRQDEGAAEAWMAQSSMSDEMKLRVHQKTAPPQNAPKLRVK